MKILFINPPIKYSLSPLPPLGIAYVAAVLRQNSYENIRIVDGASQFLSVDAIVEQAIAFGPDIIGITVMSNVKSVATTLTNILKQKLPSSLVCWGGAHATALPEHCFKNSSVDVVFRHESEFSFLEFVRRVEAHKDFTDIKGLCYKKDGTVHCNEKVARITALDSLPLPARDLLPMDKYSTVSWFGSKVKKATTIISSRGCPYECTYCANKVCWGDRKYIHRDPVKVVDEMETLVREYGVGGFQFSDECLTANRKNATAFCEELLKRKLNVSWVCSSSVKNVDVELLRLMKRAGCEFINYGIESGSPEIRKILKKNITNEDIFTAVAAAKKSGLRVGCCFLLGCPGETPATARETISMARKLAPDEVSFNIVVPFPGTEIYELLVAPKNLDLDWDEAMGFDPLNPDTPKVFFNCSQIPDRELISLYREARRKVELNIFAFRMIYNRLIHVSSPRHLFVVIKGGLSLLFKR